jgi:hypothetical protein
VTEATARRFLELATNLALLYDSATKPEKRRIVEWATSNRTATEKCVCFEPSKWLKGTKTMLAALSSADARDYSRTEARAFADLIDSVSKLSQQDSPLG